LRLAKLAPRGRMGKLILNISIYVFTKNNHKIVVQTNSNFFAEKLGKLPKFALIALTPQFFKVRCYDGIGSTSMAVETTDMVSIF
jgi:hypothetical protein